MSDRSVSGGWYVTGRKIMVGRSMSEGVFRDCREGQGEQGSEGRSMSITKVTEVSSVTDRKVSQDSPATARLVGEYHECKLGQVSDRQGWSRYAQFQTPSDCGVPYSLETTQQR